MKQKMQNIRNVFSPGFKHAHGTAAILAILGLSVQVVATAQQRPLARPGAPDAVEQAQTPNTVRISRPEQKKSEHDQSGVFAATNAPASSPVLKSQPESGEIRGFDFYRDPLNAKKPMQTFEETMQEDVSAKQGVMQAQRQLLESRYDLTPKLDPDAKMSRGQTAAGRPDGASAEHDLGAAGATWPRRTCAQARRLPLPVAAAPEAGHTAARSFPQMQIDMFPRLERFDVEFDLPEAFLPEFPPAIFLQNRPELGDVSRGEVVSINNFYRLFKDILTPVQLDGLRLLLTPLPQEEFNPTDDRKTRNPSLGVACLDCHVNGHTTAQFHLNPDIRPQQRRLPPGHREPARACSTSRSTAPSAACARSRTSPSSSSGRPTSTAIPIHAMKKGMHDPRPRPGQPHGADAEHVRLPARAEARRARAGSIRTKRPRASCAARSCSSARRSAPLCHPAPFYLDHQMHDLHAGALHWTSRGDGPIKTFTLRGIKDSPPYLHDGRCLRSRTRSSSSTWSWSSILIREKKPTWSAFMRVL